MLMEIMAFFVARHLGALSMVRHIPRFSSEKLHFFIRLFFQPEEKQKLGKGTDFTLIFISFSQSRKLFRKVVGVRISWEAALL